MHDRMMIPHIEALEMAAEWLDCYDVDSAGYEDCVHVAQWLRQQAQMAHERELARQHSVPVAKLREALARTEAR